MNEEPRSQTCTLEHMAAWFSTTWKPEDKTITEQSAVIVGGFEGLVEEGTSVLGFEE